MKTFITVLIVAVLAAAGMYFLYPHLDTLLRPQTPAPEEIQIPSAPVATSTEEQIPENKEETIIGTSVEGRPITAFHFGTGTKEILFVGGIHGGYEWNTSLVAFELLDHLKANPTIIPSDIKITIIPILNPDGLFKVTGKEGRFAASDVSSSKETQVAGRFNANEVDLNRNFDCDWKTEGVWQKTKVSGGASAFSEPESQAIKTYVETNAPTAAVVWYSAAGGVFSSNCHDGVLPQTTELTKRFAKASGYAAHEVFSYYDITGDMVNWLAKQKVPAISVLLTDHMNTEWAKNRAGIEAVLQYYAE